MMDEDGDYVDVASRLKHKSKASDLPHTVAVHTLKF